MQRPRRQVDGDRRSSSPPAAQRAWSATAARSTHDVSGRIRPVRSARSMNPSGGTSPWPGRFQRTSASSPGEHARAHVDLRLVVQDELVRADRAAQLRREREPLRRRLAPSPARTARARAPRSLAARSATSAWRSSVARVGRRRDGDRRSPPRTSISSPRDRRPAARARRRSARHDASARSSSQSTANASPPVRATTAACPTASAIRAATVREHGVAGAVAERVVDVREADEVADHDGGRAARARRAAAPAPARARRASSAPVSASMRACASLISAWRLPSWMPTSGIAASGTSHRSRAGDDHDDRREREQHERRADHEAHLAQELRARSGRRAAARAAAARAAPLTSAKTKPGGDQRGELQRRAADASGSAGPASAS